MSGYDQVAGDLQVRRIEAGSPSYAEIALRIARLREQRGGPDASARPARTTVYDVFRPGRRRMDTALVLDIVRALGADEEEVGRWADRVRDARLADPGPAPASSPAPDPAAGPAADALGSTSRPGRSTRTLDDPGGDEARPDRPGRPRPPEERPGPVGPVSTLAALLTCLGCLAVNLLGRALVVVIPEIPLYLDMVGTAVAAVVLGPWWGVGVGLGTNLLGVAFSGPESIPFALVNVVGALLWGYGVRRWRMGRTLPRFFALNCGVALVSTCLAVPIIVAMGGETGNGADDVVSAIGETVQSLWLAVASANLLTSLADKTICGFVALLAVDVLPRSVTAPVRPLMPMQQAGEPPRTWH